jgi:hypothetical protein
MYRPFTEIKKVSVGNITSYIKISHSLYKSDTPFALRDQDVTNLGRMVMERVYDPGNFAVYAQEHTATDGRLTCPRPPFSAPL